MSTAVSEERSVALRLDAISAAIDGLEAEIAATQAETGEVSAELIQRACEYALISQKQIDETARWIHRMADAIEANKAEEEWLRSRRKRMEDALDQIKAQLTVQLCDGQDPSSDDIEPKKLEGFVYKLWTQRNGPKTLMVVAETLPLAYYSKQSRITIPASDEDTEAQITDFIASIGLEASWGEPYRDDARIRESLEAGEPVPGAKLKQGRHLRTSRPKTKEVAKRQ